MSGALPQRPSNLKDTVQVKLTVFTFRVLKPNISSKGHPCELGFSPSMPRSPIIGLLSPVARSIRFTYLKAHLSCLWGIVWKRTGGLAGSPVWRQLH